MELLKFGFFGVLLIEFLSVVSVTKGIINNQHLNAANYQTLQSGTFYLNRQRPLWILKDEKPQTTLAQKKTYFKPIKQQSKYDHIKPIYVRNNQNSRFTGNVNANYKNYKSKAQKRITFYNRPQLKLPMDYIPLNQQSHKRNSYFTPRPTLPKFDSLPGQESYDKSTPIFIYTGQKGRMLFNTMMSSYQYPMQEPIPGQTLYPPRTMMMMKNSINSPQDSPVTQNPINVTMIPFYAYEAIDPRSINEQIYPTPQPFKPLPTSIQSKRLKKSKKYSAFYAPQDILSQPFDSTTPMPLTLEKPFANHKQPEVETTTSLPHKKFEVTYNDGEDKFRITYEDENNTANLERPTEYATTLEPQSIPEDAWPYGNYQYSKSYYTQPLYNLGKRIDGEETNRDYKQVQANQNIDGSIQSTAAGRQEETTKKKENTWFILNSRYKGPLNSSNKNLHSSKYIQTTRSMQNDDLDFLKATTPTTSLAKAKLKPQMRALYGDKIEIVL